MSGEEGVWETVDGCEESSEPAFFASSLALKRHLPSVTSPLKLFQAPALPVDVWQGMPFIFSVLHFCLSGDLLETLNKNKAH